MEPGLPPKPQKGTEEGKVTSVQLSMGEGADLKQRWGRGSEGGEMGSGTGWRETGSQGSVIAGEFGVQEVTESELGPGQ